MDEEWQAADYYASIGAVSGVHFEASAIALEGKVAVQVSAVSTYYRGLLRSERVGEKRKHNGDGISQIKAVTITSTQHIISEVASKCGRPMRPRVAKLPDSDILVIELYDYMTRRRVETCQINRMVLSKQICKLRKKIRSIEYALNLKQNLERGRAKPRRAPRVRTDTLKCKMENGEVAVAKSVDERAEMLAYYFGELFRDASAEEQIPDWVYAAFDAEDMVGMRVVDGYFLKEVLLGMKKGKSCAEEDLIVVEMLLHLPEEVFDVLAALFLDRLMHRNAKDDTHVWSFHTVSLIAKRAGAEFVSEFRPIALLPVVYKWYSKMLLELAKPQLQKLSKYQFAFRKNYQAGEVHFILRNLVEKAGKWQNELPGHIYTLDGDIFKAYDTTKHMVFLNAARKRKVPRVIVAAWMRELRNMQSSFKLGNIISKYITRDQSLVQGNPAAPYLFNLSLDDLIQDFVTKCRTEGWGYRVDSELIPIVVFADNFWLLSNSPTHLQAMFQCWIQMLGARGWKAPTLECVWCTTAPDDLGCEIKDAEGVVVRRAERCAGCKVLGAWLTFDNSCTREVEYRVGQSWEVFGAHRDML